MEAKRVLFVDDEEALLRLYKRMLEQAGGYEVAVEQHAKDVWKKVQSFKPQVIFLDINMPEMEGTDVAAELSSNPDLAGIPIVFLTGSITPDEVEMTHGKIGKWRFLAKPFDIKKLVACIDELIK